MRIKDKILWAIGMITLLTALAFSIANFQARKTFLLEGIDAKLMTAATIAKSVAPEGYHDRIDDKESVSSTDYLKIVDAYNRYCRELGLQYLWSVLVLDGTIHFTTGTSTSKDVKNGDHALFFDTHSNPAAFDGAIRTMKPHFSSFHNKWGDGRMVLIPERDARGRIVIYGASMGIRDVERLVRETLNDSLLMGLPILAVGLLLSLFLAGAISRPLVRLRAQAERIAKGDHRQKAIEAGTAEVASLADSLNSMSLAIREKIDQLEESREGLDITLNSIGEGMIAADLQGRVTRLNPVARALTGWGDDQEASLDEIFDVVDEQTGESLENPLKQALAAAPLPMPAVSALLISKRGGNHAISYTGAAINTPDGQADGVVLVFRNVSEQKAANEKIRRATQTQLTINAILQTLLQPISLEEQLQISLDLILSNAWLAIEPQGAIFLTDRETGDLVMHSQRRLPESCRTSCERIATGECLCGQAAQTGEILFAGHDDPQHTIHYEGMTPHSHFCVPIRSRDKTLGVVNLYLRAGHQPTKEEESFLTTVARSLAGLIERKRAEEESQARQSEVEDLNATLEERVKKEVAKNREKDRLLIQQSRLAAMGEMIGAIAHQWRQPINALNLILANILDAHDYGELTRKELEEKTRKGQEIIRRMSNSIDDFREFFRPDRTLEPFDPRQVAQGTLSLVDASFQHHHITIEKAPESETPVTALGYPNEFSQVLLVLLTNAKDAIVENQVNPGVVEIDVFEEEGWAVTRVRDNGGGIPEEIMDRIFDPYFTNKDPNLGTGIGLYMARMIIVEHMEGRIEVKNTGNGAEFRVIIPKTSEQSAAD